MNFMPMNRLLEEITLHADSALCPRSSERTSTFSEGK